MGELDRHKNHDETAENYINVTVSLACIDDLRDRNLTILERKGSSIGKHNFMRISFVRVRKGITMRKKKRNLIFLIIIECVLSFFSLFFSFYFFEKKQMRSPKRKRRNQFS